MLHDWLFKLCKEFVEFVKAQPRCPCCGSADMAVHSFACAFASATAVLDLYSRIAELESERAGMIERVRDLEREGGELLKRVDEIEARQKNASVSSFTIDRRRLDPGDH